MIEININEKYRTIVFIALFIFFICNIIFIIPYRIDEDEKYFKKVKSKQYVAEGIVTNKYIDSTFGARDAKLIFVDQRKHQLYNYDVFKEIKIGDKVRKDKNSVHFYINDVKYVYVNE